MCFYMHSISGLRTRCLLNSNQWTDGRIIGNSMVIILIALLCKHQNKVCKYINVLLCAFYIRVDLRKDRQTYKTLIHMLL